MLILATRDPHPYPLSPASTGARLRPILPCHAARRGLYAYSPPIAIVIYARIFMLCAWRSARDRSDPAGPLVVVTNHASWWDPLIGFILADLFPERAAYCPIDAAALGRYRFLERLGIFGVDQQSRHGGLAFRRRSLAVLQGNPRRCSGSPARASSPMLLASDRCASSLAWAICCARLDNATLLPVAVEYPFWKRAAFREVLTRFGTPLVVNGKPSIAAEEVDTVWPRRRWPRRRMRLSVDAVSRDPHRFETLIGGKVGVGGIYDLWRLGSSAAIPRRAASQAAHGDEASCGPRSSGDAVNGRFIDLQVVRFLCPGFTPRPIICRPFGASAYRQYKINRSSASSDQPRKPGLTP